MSDAGKEMMSQEKREKKSRDVKIVFTTPDWFNVVDEQGNFKYNGTVRAATPSLEDSCSCPDFGNRNSEEYKAEHGFALQCKHILKARSVRYAGYPQ